MRVNLAARIREAHSFTRSLSPRCLDEILGQPDVVRRLRKFIKKPYPTAMIYTGSTGVGKSCCARALAGELGADVAGDQLHQMQTGFYDLCARTLTIEELDDRLRNAWYRAMNKTGYKVVAFSEADKLKDSVLDKLNYALDNPPGSTVWVMTTNQIENMDRRFVTRCETIHFESDAGVLMPEAQTWVKQLWHDAEQKGPVPIVEDMPGVVMGNHLSFRAVVVGLQSMMEVE